MSATDDRGAAAPPSGLHDGLEAVSGTYRYSGDVGKPLDPPPTFARADVPSVTQALRYYRVMAWVVGVLLVVLVCIGMPLKYLAHNDLVVTGTGIPHGWLYMILLFTAYNLGRRVQWPWSRLLLIALAGTIPFLSFVAERYATADVRRRIAYVEKSATL